MDQGITVIPVIIGDEVNKEHVKPITDDEDRIAPVKPTDKPKDVTDTIDEQIKNAIKGTLIYRGERLALTVQRLNNAVYRIISSCFCLHLSTRYWWRGDH